MKKIVHPIAGAIALVVITSFWISTVAVEVAGSREAIVWVKTAIPWGFILLVPAMAATGGTGLAMARGARGAVLAAKKRRMQIIAANGLLILIPSALFLAWKAQADAFDTGFFVVQAVELMAGATNMVLLGLNMRAGLKMTGRIGRRAKRGR